MYIINGGKAISGKIKVQGSKNSSLPILAATILNGKTNTICDLPEIKDIEIMAEILLYLGAKITKKGIRFRSIQKTLIPTMFLNT